MKPHKFLDAIMKVKNLKNDRALADELEISTPTISKVRNGHLPVGDTLLLKAHISCSIPIKELKALIRNIPEEV